MGKQHRVRTNSLMIRYYCSVGNKLVDLLDKCDNDDFKKYCPPSNASNMYCIPAEPNEIYTVSQKKQDAKLLPITSPNVNRFSKFFHWQTHW